jgi:hypothetical protein
MQYCDYQNLIDGAMRSVIRQVLKQVEQKGLLNEHHFFINFNPNYPGVKISKKLKSQYPDELTVVLQFQFDNLSVQEDHFSIELMFSGVKESLTIPYASIISFSDPSVHFLLQLNHTDGDILDEDMIDVDSNASSFSHNGIQKEGNVIDITEMLKKR